MEIGVAKSEYAKNVELFDINNLTQENVEYMMQVIREYFKDTFPVKSELVDDILSHMMIVDDETFKKVLVESGREIDDVDLKFGFYDKKNNIGYINQDKHKTSGEIFVTIFHESLHAVSIGAGAGFKGDFVLPFGADNIEQKVAIERGLITLIEGTTHYITLKNVIGNLGFDGTDNMLRYKAERSVMSEIWAAFSEEALYRAYFTTPIEEIRRYFDMTVAPDVQNREELKTDSSTTNGKFADFLMNIGKAADSTKKILDSGEENDEEMMKIHTDIMHAVGYFLVYQHKMTGEVFTEAEKEDLRPYLEPFLADL